MKRLQESEIFKTKSVLKRTVTNHHRSSSLEVSEKATKYPWNFVLLPQRLVMRNFVLTMRSQNDSDLSQARANFGELCNQDVELRNEATEFERLLARIMVLHNEKKKGATTTRSRARRGRAFLFEV